jgi:uncharacterized membrane protein (UPF0127 family)
MKHNTRSFQMPAWQLVQVLILLVFVYACTNNGASADGNSKRKVNTPIEPRFEKEGELFILNAAATDTLQHIDIELAERPDEIQYGMMYRKSIDEQTGMLFLMGVERPQSFYMKNTYVPLDLIFINDSLKVVSISENAKPLDESSLRSIKPASLVLEVKGGFSEKYGIEPGAKITWQRKK